jgi:WD40 repeat protein
VVFKGHESQVTSAAWSPDGKRFATASADTSARIWSAGGAAPPLVFKGHERVVRSVAWSPDGKLLATASGDKTVRVWDASGGTVRPSVLRGHEGEVRSVAFRPDGREIVTASADKTARIWKIALTASAPGGEVESLQVKLREAVADCLLPDQRRTYFGEGEKDARARSERCERDHGRTPVNAD